jgi:hypothetical protein
MSPISNSQDDLDLSWRAVAMTSFNALHSLLKSELTASKTGK